MLLLNSGMTWEKPELGYETRKKKKEILKKHYQDMVLKRVKRGELLRKK